MQRSYIHQSTAYVTLVHHLQQYNQDKSGHISYHQVWIALMFKCIQQFCAIKGYLDIFLLIFLLQLVLFFFFTCWSMQNCKQICLAVLSYHVSFFYIAPWVLCFCLLKPLCCEHNDVSYVNRTLNQLNYVT